MKQTNEQINQVLTEAQEKCYHKVGEELFNPPVLKCKTCNKHISRSSWIIDNGILRCILNPSPTTNWNDYGEVLEWAKKQGMWESFFSWLLIRESAFNWNIANILTNPEIGSRAIAKFLEEIKNGN
jgi:hypothetical protein